MSSHRTNAKRLSLAGPSRWSVVLRLLMLLAAWQGPVPWCHCHGTLGDLGLADAPQWLSKHLQTHHASVAPHSSIFLGWHVHAVLPGQSSDDPNEPQKGEQFRLPAEACGVGLAEQLARAADGLPVRLTEHIELRTYGLAGSVGTDSRRAAHFFDRFAPSLPLPLRFCVARC